MNAGAALKRSYVVVYIVALIILMSSIYIHHPRTPLPSYLVGLKYSDIVYGVFFNIFSYEYVGRPQDLEKVWYEPLPYIKLVSGIRVCPRPYVDYFMEYPPLIGLIWWLTTCTSISTTFPPKYKSLDYPRLLWYTAEKHYLLQSLILAASFLILIAYIVKLMEYIGGCWKRVLVFILLPSTFVYLIYNWDIIAATFYVMSLYYLVRGRLFISSTLLCLAVSAKLLPILFALVLLVKSFIDGEAKMKVIRVYATSSLILSSIPFLLLLLISPKAVLDFIIYHSSWYCENCIYMLLIHDIGSELHRILAFITGLSIMLIAIRRVSIDRSVQGFLLLGFISILISTSLSYVFSPQMMLMISPLAVILLRRRLLLPFIIADIANALIILTFFNDLWIRSALGLKLVHSPWTIDSPTQWIAMVRNVILIAILIYMLRTTRS